MGNISFIILKIYSRYKKATYPHKDRHSRPSSIALQSENMFETCNKYKNLQLAK